MAEEKAQGEGLEVHEHFCDRGEGGGVQKRPKLIFLTPPPKKKII